MIRLRKNQDIFDADDLTAICHGCNCFNVMSKGFAKLFKINFHQAYLADQATEKGSRDKLGTYTFAMYPDDMIVGNLYTQYTWWDKDDMFYHNSFHKALLRFSDFCSFKQEKVVMGMPAIGCGLAGANPSEIYQTISVVDSVVNKVRDLVEYNIFLVDDDLIEKFSVLHRRYND